MLFSRRLADGAGVSAASCLLGTALLVLRRRSLHPPALRDPPAEVMECAERLPLEGNVPFWSEAPVA